jgi:hypothetical protein
LAITTLPLYSAKAAGPASLSNPIGTGDRSPLFGYNWDNYQSQGLHLSKIKPQTGFLFLVLAALFCLTCTNKPGPVPQFAVDNAAAARDVAISYVGPDIGKDAPAADLEWREENITPPGLIGLVTILFATDGWEITVHHPVVAPGNTIYEVTMVGLATGRALSRLMAPLLKPVP